MSLVFGSSTVYARGLEDVLAAPLLTIAQECGRELTFTDWAGQQHSLSAEWKYVNGTAEARRGRDAPNAGYAVADFVRMANERIRTRREGSSCLDRLPESLAYLSEEEVLAVRMYSGPAYQPINEFLRAVAKLHGAHRAGLARHPQLTFAATIRHLCSAIRKLAAVSSPDELGVPSYRGIKGKLDASFWRPDPVLGRVVATEPGFLSTSRSRTTPIDYMLADAPNVLWELKPAPQSDTAYHVGADIAFLSQFPAEQECLYPPCSMLLVCDQLNETDLELQHSALERGKKFVLLSARPYFT